MIRYPHFRTVATSDAIFTLQRIYTHPFFGWEVRAVILRKGAR